MSRGEKLKIGFIPLADAAALIVAADKGFTAQEGLDVELVREVSWSNVRDKLNIGVFDAARIPDPDWKQVPTIKEALGVDIQYLMLRGIFMPPKVTKEQVDYYVELFKKVRETPEWKDLMKSGAFNTTFMTGDDYAKWVAKEEDRHKALMKEAGFLAGN